jgi:hypothetical protein
MRNWFSLRPFHQSRACVKNLGGGARSNPLVDALKAFDQRMRGTGMHVDSEGYSEGEAKEVELVQGVGVEPTTGKIPSGF